MARERAIIHEIPQGQLRPTRQREYPSPLAAQSLDERQNRLSKTHRYALKLRNKVRPTHRKAQKPHRHLVEFAARIPINGNAAKRRSHLNHQRWQCQMIGASSMDLA